MVTYNPRSSLYPFYLRVEPPLRLPTRFVYDLLIPPGQEQLFVPRPSDGEVQSFQVNAGNAFLSVSKAYSDHHSAYGP